LDPALPLKLAELPSPHTPEWVWDAVFYQIFPDRFAASTKVAKPSNLEAWDAPPTIHGYKGGDLVGVAEHLDYLQDLGITAIYLNPIFESAANHRYHTSDYYAVDPILGGNSALRTLLDAAHERNMRIVLDGVFNHVGRGFYPFTHLLENGGQSPYIDWFRVYSWPLYAYGPADQPAGYESWWNNRELPKLITNTPAVRTFLLEVGEHWIREGIDGWRLDVPNEIDDDMFWRAFRSRVKRLNPEAYIVGEIWEDARRWLAGDQFDGVQNYIFTRACLSFFAAGTGGFDEASIEGTSLPPIERLNASGFRDALDSLLCLYPWTITMSQLNHLDSHDTPRYLTVAAGDESALRLAMLFVMTYPGAPCIYYGDEIGLQGGHDPDCRRSFPWDPGAWSQDLREFVRGCIRLRRAHAVLRRGVYSHLYAQDGVYIFARELEGEIAVIALNADQVPHKLDLTVPKAIEGLRSIWPVPTRTPAIVEGAIRAWQLPSRSGAVLLGRTSN